MDYRRFGIGTNVQANSTMTVAYDTDGNKRIYKALGPVNGMIVGLKRFMLGKYEASGPEFGEAYLGVTGTIVVWVIKQGLLNKPAYASDEDVIESAVPLRYQLPIMYQNQPEWSTKDRQVQREEVAKAPRDKKGRWVKE